MRPIRVLQLATSGPLYGAERWILALLRHLDFCRVESDIAIIDDLPGTNPPLLEQAQALEFATHRISCRGRVDLSAALALRRILKDRDFDIVHAHGYKADVLALLAACGTRTKTATTPHGWSHGSDWKLRLYERVDRASFAFFDAIAPLSLELHDQIARNRFAAARLHYIPNGVDLEEIEQACRTSPVPFEAKGKGPVIGYCGQLIARKDVCTLLRAFAAWGDPSASLVIVGDGPCREDLEMLARRLGIADQTHFAGFRANRLEWMRAFDAFVLPSRLEGIPRCVMEAMALELPVIATDIPGNRDLVRHGKTGFLFAPGDSKALADLLRLVETQSAGKSVTGNARQFIESAYSARAMARAYEELFEILCGRERNP